MDCQQIVDLVMKKASKDKEFKKKLIENSKQAILDETGMAIAHKLIFFENNNGELSYEVIEQNVSDEDLEKLAGGVKAYTSNGKNVQLDEEQLEKIVGGVGGKQKYPKKVPFHPICAYAAPGRFPDRTKPISPEEIKKRIDESKKNDANQNDLNK